MARAVDLTKHVVVEDHLVPQVVYLSREHAEERANHIFEPGARPPRPATRVRGAVRHMAKVVATVQTDEGVYEQDADHFEEVEHACQCGTRLHAEADGVPGAWGNHVAELTGWHREAVLRHMVSAIRADADGHPAVRCRCGASFQSADFLPDSALQAWAQHVREAVR